jgi:hypothetical protein
LVDEEMRDIWTKMLCEMQSLQEGFKSNSAQTGSRPISLLSQIRQKQRTQSRSGNHLSDLENDEFSLNSPTRTPSSRFLHSKCLSAFRKLSASISKNSNIALITPQHVSATASIGNGDHELHPAAERWHKCKRSLPIQMGNNDSPVSKRYLIAESSDDHPEVLMDDD